MSRPPITRRYRLEPLAAAMGDSMAALGRRLGVSGTTYKEACERGVSAPVADRYAVRCGLHPAQVWPSWWDDEIAEVSIECADEKCRRQFIPSHPNRRYCTPECQKRARWRRQQATRRARNPERERARKRRWDEEAREYRRRYKARWNEENRERVAAHAREYRARQKAAS